MTDLMLLVAHARLHHRKGGRAAPHPKQQRMATAGGRTKLALLIMLLVAAGLVFAPSADGRKPPAYIADQAKAHG